MIKTLSLSILLISTKFLYAGSIQILNPEGIGQCQEFYHECLYPEQTLEDFMMEDSESSGINEGHFNICSTQFDQCLAQNGYKRTRKPLSCFQSDAKWDAFVFALYTTIPVTFASIILLNGLVKYMAATINEWDDESADTSPARKGCGAFCTKLFDSNRDGDVSGKEFFSPITGFALLSFAIPINAYMSYLDVQAECDYDTFNFDEIIETSKELESMQFTYPESFVQPPRPSDDEDNESNIILTNGKRNYKRWAYEEIVPLDHRDIENSKRRSRRTKTGKNTF